MQPKLSNLMEEALRQKKYAQVCLLFGIKKKKLNKYRFVLGSIGERNKIMMYFVFVDVVVAKGRRMWYNGNVLC